MKLVEGYLYLFAVHLYGVDLRGFLVVLLAVIRLVGVFALIVLLVFNVSGRVCGVRLSLIRLGLRLLRLSGLDLLFCHGVRWGRVQKRNCII